MDKKNYEVLIVAAATVVVMGAESEEKAVEYAMDEVSFGDLELDEATCNGEIPDNQLESARRHADAIAEDPDAEENEE